MEIGTFGCVMGISGLVALAAYTTWSHDDKVAQAKPAAPACSCPIAAPSPSMVSSEAPEAKPLPPRKSKLTAQELLALAWQRCAGVCNRKYILQCVDEDKCEELWSSCNYTCQANMSKALSKAEGINENRQKFVDRCSRLHTLCLAEEIDKAHQDTAHLSAKCDRDLVACLSRVP